MLKPLDHQPKRTGRSRSGDHRPRDKLQHSANSKLTPGQLAAQSGITLKKHQNIADDLLKPNPVKERNE
jgi:hypothetical protein